MKRKIGIILMLCLLVIPAVWYTYRPRKKAARPHGPHESELAALEKIEDSLCRKYANFPRIALSEDEKKLTAQKQETLRIEKMIDWMIALRKKNPDGLRDSVIVFDKNPLQHFIRLLPSEWEELRPAGLTMPDDTETDSTNMVLDVFGKTFEELNREYGNDNLFWHNIDTLCFGMTIRDENFIILSKQERYRMMHLHYAEVHQYFWEYKGMTEVVTEVCFVRDGDTLRAFTGKRTNLDTARFPL